MRNCCSTAKLWIDRKKMIKAANEDTEKNGVPSREKSNHTQEVFPMTRLKCRETAYMFHILESFCKLFVAHKVLKWELWVILFFLWKLRILEASVIKTAYYHVSYSIKLIFLLIKIQSRNIKFFFRIEYQFESSGIKKHLDQTSCSAYFQEKNELL